MHIPNSYTGIILTLIELAGSLIPDIAKLGIGFKSEYILVVAKITKPIALFEIIGTPTRSGRATSNIRPHENITVLNDQERIISTAPHASVI